MTTGERPVPVLRARLRAGPVPGQVTPGVPVLRLVTGRPALGRAISPCPAWPSWGPRGAAGILPFTVRHGRAWRAAHPPLAACPAWRHRSCSGGAADEGADALAGRRPRGERGDQRDRRDPAGIAGGEHVWKCPAQCGWSYTTFVVAVPLRAGRLPRVRVAAGAHAWETDELGVGLRAGWARADLHLVFASAWPRCASGSRPWRG